jgi:predicted nucleic-acid-binding protein
MLAVDTNVIVRYLTADDPAQFARAVAIVEGAETFVSLTVLLETEWVLRAVYRYGSARVIRALRDFAGLPLVMVEDADLMSIALGWVENGVDFADALHLAQAQAREAFVSFDQDLVRRASALGDIPVRLP